MQLLDIRERTVTVELEPEDLLTLAEALAAAQDHDFLGYTGDYAMVEAMRAFLEAAAFAAQGPTMHNPENCTLADGLDAVRALRDAAGRPPALAAD